MANSSDKKSDKGENDGPSVRIRSGDDRDRKKAKSKKGKSSSDEQDGGVGISDYESKKDKGGRVRVAKRRSGMPKAEKQESTDKSPENEGDSEQTLSGAKRRVVEPGADSGDDDNESEADSDGTTRESFLSVEDEDVSTEDFEALLGETGDSVPDETEQFSVGDRVKGEIVAIGERYLFVDLGVRTEGIANRSEFVDEENEQLTVEEGDRVEFYVVGLDDNEIRLGQEAQGRRGNLKILREANESGLPVKGRVEDTNKGGFEVEVNGIRAFCPVSQIELGYTEEPKAHVGTTYRFKISEIRDGGDSIVLSRSELLEEERAEQRQQTLESLEEGKTVEGLVTRVTDFGAFVDLGGVEGLVHVSELSHSSFNEPGDVIDEGETVEVKVLDIEETEEDAEPRIGLSIKETRQNPWQRANDLFAVGEKVEGEVVRLAPFGAFVEVAPGIEGLVHVSEMSWEKHVKTPDEMVSVGDTIMVEVQDIDIAKERMSLSMKGAEGDPWERVEQRFARGMTVEGTVENIEDFGVFVDLGSGITALLPRSEMDLPGSESPHSQFDVDDAIEARVLEINPEDRKMALTMREAEDLGPSDDESGDGSDSRDSEAEEALDSGGTFGTLGDVIGDKIN